MWAICRRVFFSSLTNAHTTTAAKTPFSTASTSLLCSKCAISKQSGKPNCCVRGGAWFKNCGDPGDPDFDHTWFEGSQACKDSSSFSGKAQSQVMSGHGTGHTQDQKSGQKNADSISVDLATDDGHDCCKLTHITVFMSLFLTIPHLRI